MFVFSFLLYHIIILPISLLPFSFIYGLSDGVYYIIYYVTGYRKKVVFKNLRESFPEKSAQEIEIIAKKFYHHLCDLLMESLKAFTMSKESFLKRMKPTNVEVLDQYFDKHKSVALVTAHYCNWEWLVYSLNAHTKLQAMGIYGVLSNKFFNKLMLKSRSKLGMILIHPGKVNEAFEEHRNLSTATIFAADQSPGRTTKSHWMPFLNHDTSVLLGPEKYSKRFDLPVVYGKIEKVKRGFYEITYYPLFNEPVKTKDYEITETYIHFLEKIILKTPQYWLWSHRRWKHKRTSE